MPGNLACCQEAWVDRLEVRLTWAAYAVKGFEQSLALARNAQRQVLASFEPYAVVEVEDAVEPLPVEVVPVPPVDERSPHLSEWLPWDLV